MISRWRVPRPGCPSAWSWVHSNAVTARSGTRLRLTSRAAHRTAPRADSDPSTPTTMGDPGRVVLIVILPPVPVPRVDRPPAPTAVAPVPPCGAAGSALRRAVRPCPSLGGLRRPRPPRGPLGKPGRPVQRALAQPLREPFQQPVDGLRGGRPGVPHEQRGGVEVDVRARGDRPAGSSPGTRGGAPGWGCSSAPRSPATPRAGRPPLAVPGVRGRVARRRLRGRRRARPLRVPSARRGPDPRGRPAGPRAQARVRRVTLACSLVVVTTYHLGHVEFRGERLLESRIGAVLFDVPTVLTGNPVGAVLAHAAAHVTAVLHQCHGGRPRLPAARAHPRPPRQRRRGGRSGPRDRVAAARGARRRAPAGAGRRAPLAAPAEPVTAPASGRRPPS